MRIFKLEQITNAEEKAVSLGDTFLNLMERAGNVCFEEILKKYNLSNKDKVSVVCGNGKNGGDGFVIARKLFENNIPCKVLLCSGAPKAKDAISMYDLLNPLIEIIDKQKNPIDFKNNIINTDYVIDCIIGFGFKGKPREDLADTISIINSSKAKVVSIDLPTGIDCDKGDFLGEAIKADFTVAISTLKMAHVNYPAREKCGEISVVSIGMPEESFKAFDNNLYTIEKTDVENCFRERDPNSNKGNFGKILSVCGSYKMPGAAIYAGSAAMKSGCGLLTTALPKSAYNTVSTNLPESTFLPLVENSQGTAHKSSINEILNQLEKSTVCMIGCGLGNNHDTKFIIEQIIKNAKCPIIIDADGINSIAENIDILKAGKTPIILTPHPGEMARLVKKPISEIQSSRIETARSFAKQYNVTLVLKGACTVVANSEQTFVNTTGNAGMAKGGSGDVLCGIISAFVGQKMTPLEACLSGVYIHGECGDICKEKISMMGMTPKDLLTELPNLLSKYEKQGDV